MQRPQWFARQTEHGVEVRRARVILPRRPTAGWRIIFDCSVGASYLLNAFGVRRPDVVIATVPTLQGALVGAILGKLWGSPSVVLLQDLPIEAGLAVGMLTPGLLINLGRWLEGLVYRFATHLVVVGEAFRKNLISKGVPAMKISVIPDWVDLDRVHPAAPDQRIREELTGSANGFLVLHAGAMAQKQGLPTVIEAARLLATDNSIQIVLVGDGPARPGIEALIRDGDLRNVHVVGIQPDELFPRVLSAADALLLNQRADVVDAVVPSKLLTYMAAGRPVIAAVNPASVAADLITAAGCGVTVAPEDPRALADAIRTISQSPAERQASGLRGRQYAEATYAKPVALHAWEALLASLLRTTDPQGRT